MGTSLRLCVRVRSPSHNPGLNPHLFACHLPKAGRWHEARAGSLWSANQGGAPELAGFMARVRSTLRELTVADCLTTASEASGGSFGDGP